ncbi:hypothetical protein BC629DRAFT_157691 [Irpex lacteus]|nr:hypothetical protein BC629DRAFT_157691 [Irpex lacteus]
MGNTASDISEDNSIVHYLDDDVLQLVCEDLHDLVLHNKTLPTYGRPEVSMIPLSLTCKRFRTLCLPYIFQTFNLECYAKNPWWEASNKLKAWNPALSPHIREISIDMCIRYKYEDSWLANWFVSSLPDALARALHHLSTTSPHLDRISVKIADDKYPVFQAAFDKIGLAFPTVSKLAIMNCPTHDSMMQLCPNVRFLSIVGIRYVHTDEGTRGCLV